MNHQLRELGRKIAQQQDESVADGTALARAREGLAHTLRARSRRRTHGAPLLGFAAVLAVALVLLLVWRSVPQARVLSFSVDGVRDEPLATQFVDAAASPRTLRFSDGSEIALAPHSALRVLGVDAGGARVALERGELLAHVVHRSDATRWSFEAGPYRVHVIGTSFGVAWQKEAGRFSLTMKEGRVHVRGPDVDRSFDAGESFTSGEQPVVTPSEQQRGAAQPASAQVTTVDEAAADEAPPSAAQNEPNQADARSHGEAASEPALAVLVQRAERAEDEDPPEAERLYRRIREQHAGTKAASDAAFMLARLEVDPARAVLLLETYLREQPSGRYADAALGRLVRTTRKLGELERARAYARRYLERYPSGPYADEAKELLRSEP